jgi:hypothetical protein
VKRAMRVNRFKLKWHRRGDGLGLLRGQIPLVRVVPDAAYSGMWRIRHPDGRLSDIVNLTRAKDAATSIALSLVQVPAEGAETLAEAPPIAFGADPLLETRPRCPQRVLEAGHG